MFGLRAGFHPLNDVHRRIISALALMLPILILPVADARAGDDPELAKAFDSFFQLGLDASRSVPVENLRIERDGLVLELESGRLWMAEPLGGVVTGAHFAGKGTATVTASGLAGREMMSATLQGKNGGVSFPGGLSREDILRPAPGEKDFGIFKARISELFIRFTDGLDEQLAPLLQEGGGDAASASASFHARNEQMFYARGHRMERDFLLHREEGIERFAFFLAEFKVGSEWITYGYLGSSPQEIWVGTHPSMGAGVNQRVFTWTGFDSSEEYDEAGRWNGDVMLDQKNLLDVSKVKMNVDITNTLAFDIDAEVTFSTLEENLGLVSFDLINNLGYGWWEKGGRPVTLNSITGPSGNELPFIHKRNTVLIRLPEPLAAGESLTLRFRATEETIVQITDQSWLVVNTYPWFPQHGYLGGRFLLDWTIKVKSPLSAIASGDLVSETEEEGRQVTHWVLEKESALASLIFGRFQSREDTYENPETGKKVKLVAHANPRGDFRGTSKSKSILVEAKNILTLFETLFGPYPYNRLDITQMAPFAGFGQAPPGLLFLTGDAFLPTGVVTQILSRASAAADAQGQPKDQFLMRGPYYHDFFAHELGHQWWGHNVTWGRDEDVWLSEAFTEYASALYAFQIDGMDKFQDKLARWKEGVRDAEKSGFPIAAANMASASDMSVAGKYRTGLLYEKGAYVVHMLRMTIGHDQYVESMKRFHEKYSDQMVSTRMLKETVEEVTGQKMGWFFDQWFYGSGTPSFRFSYDVDKTEDGGYIVTGRIRQDEETFKQVMMPVFYEVGGAQPSVQNVAISKPDFTFKAKLPVEPKKVWLDEYNTILGDIIVEKH